MRCNLLLDTSAFRALSKNILSQLQDDNHNIFVSPYSFWELLCHLDAKDKFEYYKTNLLKLDYVQILDDPLAEFESTTLINDNKLAERISDHELINGLLNALENSSTLKEFYSFYMKDSKGEFHLISDCAKRAREFLDKEEIKHAEFSKKIIGAFESEEASVKALSDHNERILELINGYRIYLENHGADKKLGDKIVQRTYIYYSYIFYRALNGFKVHGLKIDKNDYEDAYICFHLNLNTKYCLVTYDTGMKAALEQTISLINQIKDKSINTSLQVYDKEFIESLISK